MTQPTKLRFLSFLLALAVLCALPSGPARAIVNSATPVPATKEVPSNTTVSIVITWRIVSGAPPVLMTVEADDGILRIGAAGTILRTTAPLSRTFNLPPALNNFTSTFTETLTVPRGFLQQALKAGEALTYSREFTDNGFTTSVVATVTIVPSTATAADFDVTQIRLTFGDQSAARTTEPGEKLVAVARLSTAGAGMLRGSWQVREGGVAGNWRTLRQIRQPISGQRDIHLTSPALPTDGEGRYDVRLALDEPDVAYDEPFISYFIGSGLDRTRATVTTPDPGKPIGPDTLIRWKPVNGAKAYRVEARQLAQHDDNAPPVAAMLVEADKFSVKPSPLFMEGLKADGKYQIWVIAIR